MSIDTDEVQRRWRGVARHFPLWRFGIDLFFDVDSWRMIGADITSMMLQNKNVRRAAGAMDGASAETLEALAGVAKVNEARSNDIFRAIFLGYVSVPIAFAALLSDAAPEALNSFVTEYSGGIVMMVIGGVLFPVLYFCGNWRAKQIAWTVELYRGGALKPLPAGSPR